MTECEFILVRHSQTYSNRLKEACGYTDSQLTEAGIMMAQDVSHKFSNLQENIKYIYNSFLNRSLHTAQIFSMSFPNASLRQMPNIEEQCFGSWEGLPWEKVLPLLKRGHKPPNGESRNVFSRRTMNGIKNIINTHDNDSVPLVIAHGGTFYAIGHQFGFEVEDIPNCFICKFRFENKKLDTPPLETKIFNNNTEKFEKKDIYVQDRKNTQAV